MQRAKGFIRLTVYTGRVNKKNSNNPRDWVTEYTHETVMVNVKDIVWYRCNYDTKIRLKNGNEIRHATNACVRNNPKEKAYVKETLNEITELIYQNSQL